MRQAEILNGLEAITELLYEVDAYDKEYSSQVIANAMEIIMEVDLWVEKIISQSLVLSENANTEFQQQVKQNLQKNFVSFSFSIMKDSILENS